MPNRRRKTTNQTRESINYGTENVKNLEGFPIVGKVVNEKKLGDLLCECSSNGGFSFVERGNNGSINRHFIDRGEISQEDGVYVFGKYSTEVYRTNNSAMYQKLDLELKSAKLKYG